MTTVNAVVANAGRYPEVKTRQVARWLDRLLEVEFPRRGEIGVRFVSDREMRRLNASFRGKDQTTDVLSFPGEDDGDGPYLGDVAVSVPQARRQAAERGHEVDLELRLLVLHGVLHCAGFDHETDRGEFSRRERALRRRWGSA